ncbi:DUF1275 family protein [Streptomyces sp. NPDC052287]|uniref:DUF1275 family protein n=1 Tax=unclassified Streptomyces TaxID=2593676 RepID=UPI00343A8185
MTGAGDAISFLALGGVFTSVMTANLALLGLAVGSRDLILRGHTHWWPSAEPSAGRLPVPDSRRKDSAALAMGCQRGLVRVTGGPNVSTAPSATPRPSLAAVTAMAPRMPSATSRGMRRPEARAGPSPRATRRAGQDRHSP